MTGMYYKERSGRVGAEADLEQTQVAVGVGDAELVAVLRESHPRHLGVGAGRTGYRHGVFVAPFVQVD